MTAKALEEMGVPYYIVVEEQQYEDYAKVIDPKKILILDKKYQEEYDTFDDLGMTKSVGPGAARNFIWEHSMSLGFKRHWVMDDNILRFLTFNDNRQIKCVSGALFAAMEDFCDKYTNVAMAGPNYFMFVARKTKAPPFVLNTRIYSCNLILNEVPFRWRGRYNEDTDLSLRMLKAGWVTVQFNTFLQHKMTTQTVKGGNHADFYSKEGTYPKSKMLVEMHPDVAEMVYKFHRCHHFVDYTPFKNNKLLRIKTGEGKKAEPKYKFSVKKIR